MTDAGVVVWYNPRCSKCRGAGELLASYGVPAQRVYYLDDPAQPGRDRPRAGPARRHGPACADADLGTRHAELGLASATADELIDAMAQYPELIERPVVIWADRAVVARPPELLLPLLEAGQKPAQS